MATPNYLGQGQPTAATGGFLNGIFGNTTPAYAGAVSQSAPRARSMFGYVAPAYKLASSSPPVDCDPSVQPQIAIVIPRQSLDPQT